MKDGSGASLRAFVQQLLIYILVSYIIFTFPIKFDCHRQVLKRQKHHLSTFLLINKLHRPHEVIILQEF